MIIFPSLDETILSEKTPEDICAALSAVTVTWKQNRHGDRRSEFIGEVSTVGFKIAIRIWYRNSFMPFIKGTIRAEGNISIITIKMRMHPLTYFISVGWLSGMAAAFLLGGLALLIERSVSTLIFFGVVSLAILLFQLLMRNGFYRPAKKALARLQELCK